jgi:dihydrofolate reductase
VDWLAPFESSAEDYGYADFYASVDAVLLGSRTYEQALTFGEWPYAGKPAWVFSRRLEASGRDDVSVTADAPRDVVAQLAARWVHRAWLVGGGEIAGAFEAAGLITECIVSIMPVILGGGVRLFGEAGAKQQLRLLEQKAYPDGVLQARYVPTAVPSTTREAE